MMSFIKVLEDFDNIHSLITLLYKLQKEAGGENFLGGEKKHSRYWTEAVH